MLRLRFFERGVEEEKVARDDGRIIFVGRGAGASAGKRACGSAKRE